MLLLLLTSRRKGVGPQRGSEKGEEGLRLNEEEARGGALLLEGGIWNPGGQG